MGGESKDWYGYSSFKDLMMDRAPKLGLKYVVKGSENFVYDPKSYQPPEEPDTNGESSSDEFDAADQLIKRIVDEWDEAIPGSNIAQILHDQFKRVDWFGYTSFGAFIKARAEVLGLVYVVTEEGLNFLYDPERHEDPIKIETDHQYLLSEEEEPDLMRLVTLISQVTGLPLLRSSVYERLFSCIAKGCKKHGFDQKVIVTAVHDELTEEAMPVPENDVAWVLGTLEQVGFPFDKPDEVEPVNLALYYHIYVTDAFKRYNIRLDKKQEKLIKEWLQSGNH